MKIAYVTDMRMPTERAHGIAVVSMCEALAGLGADIELHLPRRAQSNPALEGQTPAAFYGIRHAFPIEFHSFVDLLPLETRGVPARLLGPAMALMRFRYAAFVARQIKGCCDAAITREWWIARSLVAQGIPTICEIHEAPTARQLSAIGRMLGRGPFAVVAISHWLKKDMTTRMSLGAAIEAQARIHVLPSAVNMRPYQDAVPRRLAPEGWRSVVYTGSLEDHQGVLALMKASAAFSEKTALVLVGGSPEQLKQVAFIREMRELWAVTLHGYEPPSEMPAVQRGADILAYTPRPDVQRHGMYASSLKLYQYMAAGRPILAADVPSVRQALTHEKTAWLVEPAPSAIAEGVRYLLDNPALTEELARNASKCAEQNTWGQRAHRLLVILEGIAS